MKIALAQTHIIWENKKLNIDKAKNIISTQVTAGVDAIFFPEMSFTGFSMNTSVTRESDDQTINEIRDIAQEFHTTIGFGWVKDCGQTCENHYTVLNCDGETISDYAKIHPFSYSGEDKYFRGGNKLSIFTIGDVPFTSFICYDLRFPELFRKAALKIHAIIIPANWPAQRSEHWKILLRARAIENQAYIFAINCFGYMHGQYYSGGSCVINPNGTVLETLSDEEGIITFDFNDDVLKYRSAFPVFQDIRWNVYNNL